MSRHFVLGTWANADEYNYSGEQLMGHRQGKSVCMDHMLPSGMANLSRYGDPVSDKPKAPTKVKSAFSQVSLPDSHYERLCGLSEALDLQLDNGELGLEDWSYARRQLDTRLVKAWSRLCLARGWDENNLDTTLNDGLSFNLGDIQKPLKRDPKQRNTGWATIDQLSPDNCFRGLFWRFKQVMMMASKGIIATKQIIATIKQAHKQEN